ncbi:MAG: endonuclease domain-containing protein [Gammaproteobacteria bacterium]
MDIPKFSPADSTNSSPLEGEPVAQGRSPQWLRWGDIKRQYTTTSKKNANSLRKSQTDAENLLWYHLRNKQLDGHKFRRQQPIGNYIVDFVCMSQKLVVELDGGQHAEQQARDKERDTWLHKQGYRILRFWNNDVIENCYGVLETIDLALGGSLGIETGSATDPPTKAGFASFGSPSRGEQ